MSVDCKRDPRLAKEVSESLSTQNNLHILSVSTLENKTAAGKGNDCTKVAAKSKSQTYSNALPPVDILSKPSSVPISFVRQNKSLLPQLPTASNEAALKEAVFIGDADEVCRILSLSPSGLNAPLDPLFLTLAATRGFADIAGLLLRAGAEVDAKAPQTESTPLMIAAESGYTMVAMVLLQWGGDPDAANAKAETALLLAVRGGHFAIAKLLLDHGANPLPSISALRPKRSLLPLQLARHLGRKDIQEALIAANRMMDQYLTNLVNMSLPTGVRLIDPGHSTSQQSITSRSFSFIPVQIISMRRSASLLQFTFSTPPYYSHHFSSVGQGSALDELILLYVASVDLESGQVVPPRCNQSMPAYNLIAFNGSRKLAVPLNPVRNFNASNNSLSSNRIEADELPGFRTFVLGSRLNNGGLNSISMHSNLPPSEAQKTNPFRKLLIGVYRVRVELSAFSKEINTGLRQEIPALVPAESSGEMDNKDDCNVETLR